MQNLGLLPGATSSEANGISADGMTVVGGSGGRAFRWTISSGMESLGVAPGDIQSNCTALSADGLAAIGHGRPSGGESRPIRWTAEEGMHVLPRPAPYGTPTVHGISAHGTVVGGSDWVSGPHQRAYIWTRGLGTVYLDEYLAAHGVDLAGWRLRRVTGVSYDGSAIVGSAVFGGEEGEYCGFLITGLFKKSDYNHDGFVDGIDYDQFMNDFETADPAVQIRSDVNFDWAVDGLDYDQFMVDFESGR
jgi:uncharacterized membrane protein